MIDILCKFTYQVNDTGSWININTCSRRSGTYDAGTGSVKVKTLSFSNEHNLFVLKDQA